MPGGGVQLVVRMCGQAPELSPVAEDHLSEAALQGTLQDVVSRGAHIDVAVIATRTLRVDGPHAASGFWELKRIKFKDSV